MTFLKSIKGFYFFWSSGDFSLPFYLRNCYRQRTAYWLTLG